eukprot:m.273419 g.273419  ORF g.273419 m.273419 type:complete len:54 (-) comp16280_c0_seq2:244-405(-)
MRVSNSEGQNLATTFFGAESASSPLYSNVNTVSSDNSAEFYSKDYSSSTCILH